jgi:hypothetical protein
MQKQSFMSEVQTNMNESMGQNTTQKHTPCILGLHFAALKVWTIAGIFVLVF